MSLEEKDIIAFFDCGKDHFCLGTHGRLEIATPQGRLFVQLRTFVGYFSLTKVTRYEGGQLFSQIFFQIVVPGNNTYVNGSNLTLQFDYFCHT